MKKRESGDGKKADQVEEREKSRVIVGNVEEYIEDELY